MWPRPSWPKQRSFHSPVCHTSAINCNWNEKKIQLINAISKNEMRLKQRTFLTYDRKPQINGNADESPVLLFCTNLRHTNLIRRINTWITFIWLSILWTCVFVVQSGFRSNVELWFLWKKKKHYAKWYIRSGHKLQKCRRHGRCR